MIALLLKLLARFQKPSAASAPALAEVVVHETQTFPETLARIAESQIGKREKGGNNLGPDVVEFQKATWLVPGQWPWCAAFVCWCVWQTIVTLTLKPLWPRPRTAGAYDFEQWATGKYGDTKGAWRVLSSVPSKPETWPRRGDIITFTWSHIGIVTNYDQTTRRIQTVEGNAGLHATSDSAQGDGVVAKEQHISRCRRLIRYVG